jgi:predicted RND superfamily exporter protein
MFMEKVGKWVTGNPVLAIIIVLLITSVFGLTWAIKGLNDEFDEGSFLPDVEMAKADSEVSDNFEREYSIPVLVKSNNNNVLTPATQIEILQLEKELSENSFLSNKFEDPEDNSKNFNSIAEQLIYIYLMDQNLLGLAQLCGQLEGLNKTFSGINQNLSFFLQQMNTIDLTNSSETLQFFETLNSTLSIILLNLPDLNELLGAFGGNGGSGQNGEAGGGFGAAMDLDFDQKIGIMQSMDDNQLIQLITGALNYDGSTCATIREVNNGFLITSREGFGISSTLNGLLMTLRNDPTIFNTTLYPATSNNSTVATDFIDLLLTHGTTMTSTFGGISMGFAAMDLANTTLQIDTTFTYLGFGLSYMLTKDFQPDLGNFNAKGTLILVYFNSSIGGSSGAGMGHSGDNTRLEIEHEIQGVTKDFEWKQVKFSVIGNNIIGEVIMDANTESLMILLVISIIFVLVILSLILRSFFDMGMSLLALGFGIVWMYGAGALMEFTFNPITTMVPVLIIGLGIDYSIHIFMRYREERNNAKTIERAMKIAITSVGAALLFATITTVVAFLSNLSSALPLLGEFGILAAIGIIGCFISMTIFIPAVKQIWDKLGLWEKLLKRIGIHKRKSSKTGKSSGGNKNRKVTNLFNKGIASGAVAAARYPAVVIGVTIIVTLGAMYGVMNLETKFDFEDFLPKDLEVTKDINYLMNEFGTSSFVGEETVFLLIKGDISEPSVITSMHETINNMEDDEYVNKKILLRFDNNNGNGNITANQMVPDVNSIISLIFW